MNILLDTNAVIYYLAGNLKIKQFIKDAFEVCISFILK
jgi:predicted nucleic acid-binding protein